MSLKLKEKKIPILQEYEAKLLDGIKNGNYGWVTIDSDRKERLFRLITLYKEFFELAESVENLNEKVNKLTKLKEEDDN